MKTPLRLVVLALALGLSGCATVIRSGQGGHDMVAIENTGWYLFNFIPLGAGDPNHPNQCCCRFFTDTATLENNMRILRKVVEENHASHAENIVSHTSDEKIFFILLRRFAFHTSAELITETPDPAESLRPSTKTEEDLCELLNM